LTTFDGGSLTVTDGATVLDGDLASLNGVAVTLDGTGTIQTSQWQSLTNGSLTINGGDYSSTTSPPFASLSNIDGSNISVGEGSLALPAVTSMSINPNDYGPTTFQVGNDGILNLPGLTAISSGNPVTITASGQGSEIDLPDLSSIVLNSYDGDLSVTDGGTVLDGNLTSLNGVRVTLDGTGPIQTSQWETLTNGSLTIEGGDYSSTTSPPFANLADIDGSSVSVEDGGSLTLPAVITYTNPNSYAFSSPLQASGAGSTLSLPGLTSLSVSGFDTDVAIQALQGGQTLLPSLVQITVNSAYSGSPGVLVDSDGSGSLIDLSSLTIFSGGAAGGGLTITDGGTVLDPNLASLSNVNLTTASTASFTLASNQTYAASSGAGISVTTGTLVDQGALSVTDTATLTLNGSLEVDGEGALAIDPTATLNLSGGLVGDTENVADFTPMGTVVFDGGAGAGSPQYLEAMSNDMGATQGGFINNSAFGTISLTNNTYVQLVDQAHNSSGTGPEAVYAGTLIVPAGATLNLNGLNMYVGDPKIAGTVLNGSVIQVPGGSPIVGPDLVVTSITPPPNGVYSGQSVPITYTVENIGEAPTNVPVWQDAVILSQDPTLTYAGGLNPTGPGSDQLLNNQPVVDYFNNPSYLGVGQS